VPLPPCRGFAGDPQLPSGTGCPCPTDLGPITKGWLSRWCAVDTADCPSIAKIPEHMFCQETASMLGYSTGHNRVGEMFQLCGVAARQDLKSAPQICGGPVNDDVIDNRVHKEVTSPSPITRRRIGSLEHNLP